MSGILTIHEKAVRVKAVMRALRNAVDGMLEPNESNDELAIGYAAIFNMADDDLADIVKIANNIK